MNLINKELKKFLTDLSGNLDFRNIIEAIETEPRDGFIPYAHNKGGFELKAFTNLRHFFGSGKHSSTYASNFIEYLIDRDRAFYMECNQLTEDDMVPGTDQDEAWLEGLSDENNSVYFQLTLMLTSENTLDLNMYLEGSDAPYHRGYDFKFEAEIEFKNLSELKAKLKEQVQTIKKFFMLDSSKVGEFEACESRSIYSYQIRKPMSEIDETA